MLIKKGLTLPRDGKKYQSFKKYDYREPDNLFQDDSGRRHWKKEIYVPKNGKINFNIDISFNFGLLQMRLKEFNNVLLNEFDFILSSANKSVRAGSGQHDFYNIADLNIQGGNGTERTNRPLDNIILPVFAFGKELSFFFQETGNDSYSIWDIFFHEAEIGELAHTTPLMVDESTPIGASASGAIEVNLPPYAKYASMGVSLQDTNAYSKDFRIQGLCGGLASSNWITIVEDTSGLTQNEFFFDLVPINPLFTKLRFQVTNNGGTAITLIYLYFQWFFK